jgi:hypothetical protein
MAEVYRARDPRLGRDVALKILPADHASDPARVRRFQHEAHAVAALNHPNILALYDTGTEDGVTYAVFELLEGQTLRGLLQKGPVARAKVVDYGVQVCRGLAAAHEKGIVHRDLKPENLFLTRDGVVKILDFGLARLVQPREDEQTGTLSQGTDAGVVMGTVGYMSPEQVRGEPADHRSDLFSLGAVLYEMLSGQRAFRGTSSVETLNAILKEEPAEIVTERKIPPALERLVRHCLEKSPDDRFQSARDLAFELGGLSTPSGIGAPPLVPAGAGRLRRWLALGLATVVIGSSLFGGGVLLGRRRTPSPIPSYKQITFRRGIAASGRFTPDGKTVVYAASWDDAPAPRICSVRIDAPESQPLDLPPGQVVGVSSKGEVAILMPKGAVSEMVVYPELPGTLARVPLSGGTPRPVAENVVCADWAPDGDRLAALRAVDGALQIEFPLGTVLARETPEDRLFACPRFSPRGDRLAFGTGNGYRVVEIGSGRAFSIGVPEWGHGTWWSWSPDGREIWFTAGLGNSWPLEAVTLDGRRRLLARIPGTTVLYDVSRDGRLLLQHNFARTRSFARAPGEVTEREVSVFDSTLVADISADGTLALLTERGAAAGPGEFILPEADRWVPADAAGRAGSGHRTVARRPLGARLSSRLDIRDAEVAGGACRADGRGGGAPGADAGAREPVRVLLPDQPASPCRGPRERVRSGGAGLRGRPRRWWPARGHPSGDSWALCLRRQPRRLPRPERPADGLSPRRLPRSRGPVGRAGSVSHAIHPGRGRSPRGGAEDDADLPDPCRTRRPRHGPPHARSRDQAAGLDRRVAPGRWGPRDAGW